MLVQDLNGDGVVDAGDLPFTPGTNEAKLWWKKFEEQEVRDPNKWPAKFKRQYGDRLKGVYKGKPLVPGEAGPGQGDFKFLVDKLIINYGYKPDVAQKIAGKAYWTKYGGAR